MPSRLPPIRGIEHQIDFVPGVTIPNRTAYRSNLEETKELQRQVEELLTKGHMRESMSLCTVLVLLVAKNDGTWRMCVDCRVINNIMVTIRGRILLKRGGMIESIAPLKDPLHVPVGPITKARSKKIKEALNGLIQEIWANFNTKHSKLGPKEDEGATNSIQAIDKADLA